MDKRIESAPTDRIDRYESEVSRILRAIAKYMVEDDENVTDWVDTVFVSDKSQVSDFLYKDADLQSLANDLGLFALNGNARVVDVAVMLRQMQLKQ